MQDPEDVAVILQLHKKVWRQQERVERYLRADRYVTRRATILVKRNAKLTSLYEVIRQVNGLLACTRHIQDGRILPGVIGRKIGARLEFRTGAEHAALDAVDLVHRDVIHTARTRPVLASSSRISARSSFSLE